MGQPPRPPGWVRWAMKRLLPPAEHQSIMDELQELHAHWARKVGAPTADRRYLKQLSQYPFRLLAQKVTTLTSYRRGLMPFQSMFRSLRSLAKVPVLTAAIVGTVGVGIGGCTIIFSIIDVLFIRPLPYPEADRIVFIQNSSPGNQYPLSVVDFQAIAENQTTFEAVAAYDFNVFTLLTPESAERVQVASVTPGYLELLGIDLLAGRTAGAEDGREGAEPSIVVTPGFVGRYMQASGEEPVDALGQTVRMDGLDYRVIGVAPEDFGPLTRWAEAFTTLQPAQPTRRGPFSLAVFGRIRDGVDPSVAAQELDILNDRLYPLWAESYQDQAATWGMVPLPQILQGNVQQLLLILMGSVGLLLLTATANAANLLLARVGGRRRELAVRSALGAAQWRIVGHLLTESTLLALGGVGLGLLLASWGTTLLPAVASAYIPRLSEVHLSGPVLLFAWGLAVACGLVFGLIAALQGSAGNLSRTLRGGGRTATEGLGQQRAQQFLVVGQLAVVVPLLAGAGLLLSSFANLTRVDLGFDAEAQLSVRVPLSSDTYPDSPARTLFWDQVLDRVGALPGILAAGVASGRPPTTPGMTNNFNLEDKPTAPGASEPSLPWLFADNEFFQALGIPLLEGRMFQPTDLDDGAPPVILVDQAFAHRFFPREEVLGRRLVSAGCTTCPLTTVVGVVGTVPYLGVRRADEGTVYAPGSREILSGPYLHIRVAGDPTTFVPRIREEIRAVDAGIPLTDFATGESLFRDSLREPRHLSLLLASFALVALTLAVLGLYGIVSYTVHRRRGDIAVRLALGGAPRDVWYMVIRQGMAMVLVGLILGSLGAVALTRVLSGVLFQVEAGDPRILLAVAALLMAVSLAACALPGRRAVRVNPVSALKEE
jgi:predicted permease